MDIQSLSYIRAYSSEHDLDILASTNTQRCRQLRGIDCLHHTVLAHSQQLVLYQLEDDLNWQQNIPSDIKLKVALKIEEYLTLFFFNTSNEGVPTIAQLTATNRIMIDHLATCIQATNIFARIFAFLIDARFI